MRNGVRLTAAMAILLLCQVVFGAVAGAYGFSADVVSYYGSQTLQGKVYMDNDRIRFESAGTISITRLDKQVLWLLMPSEKMYMEQEIRLQNLVPSPDPFPGELDRTLLGSETVNGVKANKYRVTLRLNKQGQSYLEWLAADSGQPLRMAAEDGRWVQEYRNVKVGNQEWKLFEIPDGYKVFGMTFGY